MIRCAYCDSVTLALDLNGVDAHVCPLCGAVFARKNKKSYALVADLHGAQGVKELLHQRLLQQGQPQDSIKAIQAKVKNCIVIKEE